MTTGAERTLLRLSILAVIALAACGDSGPSSLTGSSDIPSREFAGQELGFGSTGELAGEDFDCAQVEAVRARFSSPGHVDHDEVGLYVYFGGLGEGPKRLRIWWDYENDPSRFRDFRFPAEVTEIEEVYEHRYHGLSGPTEMLVRVELIRDGLTGNCARNRRVLVAPPEESPAPTAPTTPTTTSTASVGPGIASVDNYDFFYSEGVRFTVFTSLTIDGVAVDPSGSGTLKVNLWDDTGTTLLGSRSVAVTAGPQQIALGFSVPPGSYLMDIDGTTVPSVGVSYNGSSFPYQIPGVIALTDTTFGFGGFGWYYFLYDWQVTW